MKNKLLTKTFFKFMTGFIMIIFLGIAGAVMVGLYDENQSIATPPSIER